MKKGVVISTSLRPDSNSNMLADQFAEGAKAAGEEDGEYHRLSEN